MSEYPWNEKNNTFTWSSSLYNPFNIFLWDFFLFLPDIPVENYTDDNTPYGTDLIKSRECSRNTVTMVQR